jgi:hypothetical protein
MTNAEEQATENTVSTPTEARKTANPRARKPRVARTAAKTTKKARKAAPRAKAAKAKPAGSKKKEVVAMLQRKGGASITEIMGKMNWQRHTVRGFMAGAMKKAGFAVESFKPEGGERSYRLSK